MYSKRQEVEKPRPLYVRYWNTKAEGISAIVEVRCMELKKKYIGCDLGDYGRIGQGVDR